MRLTTRGSSTSIESSGSQSIVNPSPGTHRGEAVNPGRRSRGRSATRTMRITSSPARIAPGLKTADDLEVLARRPQVSRLK